MWHRQNSIHFHHIANTCKCWKGFAYIHTHIYLWKYWVIGLKAFAMNDVIWVIALLLLKVNYVRRMYTILYIVIALYDHFGIRVCSMLYICDLLQNWMNRTGFLRELLKILTIFSSVFFVFVLFLEKSWFRH